MDEAIGVREYEVSSVVKCVLTRVDTFNAPAAGGVIHRPFEAL